MQGGRGRTSNIPHLSKVSAEMPCTSACTGMPLQGTKKLWQGSAVVQLTRYLRPFREGGASGAGRHSCRKTQEGGLRGIFAALVPGRNVGPAQKFPQVHPCGLLPLMRRCLETLGGNMKERYPILVGFLACCHSCRRSETLSSWMQVLHDDGWQEGGGCWSTGRRTICRFSRGLWTGVGQSGEH